MASRKNYYLNVHAGITLKKRLRNLKATNRPKHWRNEKDTLRNAISAVAAQGQEGLDRSAMRLGRIAIVKGRSEAVGTSRITEKR